MVLPTQMTQLLMDHSLLMGSSIEGVFLHDLTLSFVRNRQSAEKLRMMHSDVCRGLIAESESRGLQGLLTTNSGTQACDGEEVSGLGRHRYMPGSIQMLT